MRFLFSDVSNDAHVEADEGADGDYLMPFQVYAEAVLALVKVAEAARAFERTLLSDDSFVDTHLHLCEALSAFDFGGDA